MAKASSMSPSRNRYVGEIMLVGVQVKVEVYAINISVH